MPRRPPPPSVKRTRPSAAATPSARASARPSRSSRARLEAAKAEVAHLERESRRLGEERLALAGRVGDAEGQQRQLLAKLEDDSGRRIRAAAAFQRFAGTGLLATALPALDLPDSATPWAPDPAVRLARRVEQALVEVDADDPAWERVQQELTHRFKELAEALTRYGHEATADLAEDRFVVAVVFQGQRRTPDQLVGLLGEEVDHRERVLSAKERELLEEHLVNEVASHLQELIVDAEHQVQQMNDELEERPTSTGMRLRFRWEPLPDGPPGLAEARRRLLRQASDAWSLEDRAAVSAFLQERIAAERVRDESGTWLEHLTAAFDYRHLAPVHDRALAGRPLAFGGRPGLQRRAGAHRDPAAVRRRLRALPVGAPGRTPARPARRGLRRGRR